MGFGSTNIPVEVSTCVIVKALYCFLVLVLFYSLKGIQFQGLLEALYLHHSDLKYIFKSFTKITEEITSTLSPFR
jgi:hypothetical protein